MTLGEKLKQARAAKGMSQSQVCGNFITRNMLSQLEHDQASPSLKTLEYLSEVLELPIAWMVGEDDLVRERQQLKEARDLYMAGEYQGCMERLQEASTGAQEERLLLCKSALAAGRQAFTRGETALASAMAERAMTAAASCIYCGPWERLQAGLLRAGCLAAEQKSLEPEIRTWLAQYDKLQLEDEQNLLRAALALEQGALPEAERALSRMTASDGVLASLHDYLKGAVLLQQNQPSGAQTFLQQAEGNEAFPRSLQMALYERLEHCYREQEDYRNAYHYASLRLNHT